MMQGNESLQWLATVVGGILTAGFVGLVAWMLGRLIDMMLRIRTLEARPHVDVVAYTLAIADLTKAVASQTTALTENSSRQDERYRTLAAQYADLGAKLDETRNELKEQMHELVVELIADPPNRPREP